MFKSFKVMFIDIFLDCLFIALIIIIPVLYFLIIPDHWGKLTLVTLAALCYFWAKLHEKLIK